MKYKDCNIEDLKFNGEQLTEESLNKAIQSFIDNCNNCIEGARNKEFRVNDIEDYVKWQEEMRDKYINREFNLNLTLLQNAYYIQTGKSIALLP